METIMECNNNNTFYFVRPIMKVRLIMCNPAINSCHLKIESALARIDPMEQEIKILFKRQDTQDSLHWCLFSENQGHNCANAEFDS